MIIKEVEKRDDFTIATYYSVRSYLKEKGFKKTIKALIKEKYHSLFFFFAKIAKYIMRSS